MRICSYQVTRSEGVQEVIRGGPHSHNGLGKGEVTHRKGCESETSVKLSEV